MEFLNNKINFKIHKNINIIDKHIFIKNLYYYVLKIIKIFKIYNVFFEQIF